MTPGAGSPFLTRAGDPQLPDVLVA